MHTNRIKSLLGVLLLAWGGASAWATPGTGEEQDSGPVTHKLHVQQPYFDQIQQGKKVYEIRTADEEKKKIKVGDRISFFYDKENQNLTCDCEVTEIFNKTTFQEMLEYVGIKHALPHVSGMDNAVQIYLGIPSYKEKEKLGVLAFHLKALSLPNLLTPPSSRDSSRESFPLRDDDKKSETSPIVTLTVQ